MSTPVSAPPIWLTAPTKRRPRRPAHSSAQSATQSKRSLIPQWPLPLASAGSLAARIDRSNRHAEADSGRRTRNRGPNGASRAWSARRARQARSRQDDPAAREKAAEIRRVRRTLSIDYASPAAARATSGRTRQLGGQRGVKPVVAGLDVLKS